MFDPTIGRWQSKDPKSFDAGDTNLYRYVGNHPSYATDPSGLEEDYRKIFFDAAKRSAMNSVPFLTELEQKELPRQQNLWVRFGSGKSPS